MSIETELQKLIDQTNQATQRAGLQASMEEIEVIAVSLLAIQKVIQHDPPNFALACVLTCRFLIQKTCPQEHKQFFIDLATKLIAGAL